MSLTVLRLSDPQASAVRILDTARIDSGHRTHRVFVVHTYTKPQTSSTRSRGLGWRIHGSVEDTKLSTNKQHTLFYLCRRR